ncbi:MAG: hypothetical protein JO257_25760 [Deltaproteobacteria bacterium]|nr:hypothetical protein [Deltaproteobacteria bacterium]
MKQPGGLLSSRAAIRRALCSRPDAGRASLISSLDVDAADAERAAAYLLDPRGAAIVTETLHEPVFEWVGPGNAAPIDDQLAALIAMPALSIVRVLERRWTPRADEAVAAAVVATQYPEAAFEQLARDAGPDPELLALGAVQCGRVLAWSPQLQPQGERIVDALLARLGTTTPRPLLELVARALGPLARGHFAERILRRARAGLERPKASSFSQELAGVDQDWNERPRREHAAACAYILGFAAPHDREAFVGYRAAIFDREDAADVMVPFVDGMIAAAHIPAVTELAIDLFDGGNPDTALALAAQLPMDDIAGALIEALEAPSAGHRALACSAVELLAHDDVDPALADRLADPSPEVAAAAASTLLARGRRDLVAKHSGHEAHPVRRAVVLAALGERTVPVIGELVRGGLAELEAASEDVGPSPVTRLVAESLLTTVDGVGVAADLIAGVPEAAGLLALAGIPAVDRDIAVTAPADARVRLAEALTQISDDGELRALGLYLLARMSAGDATLAPIVVGELSATDGEAGTLVGALGELRVATPETAAVLAPLVGPQSPIGARVIAAAVCGRALPAGHPAWVHVRELLELGTIARAAAWSALRDRVRIA